MIHTPTCPHMNVRTHLTDKSVELLARHITYMYVRDTYQVTQTGSTINRKKTCLVNTRRWTALCSVSDSSKKAALPPPHCGFNTERTRKPPTPHCGKPLSPAGGGGGGGTQRGERSSYHYPTSWIIPSSTLLWGQQTRENHCT